MKTLIVIAGLVASSVVSLPTAEAADQPAQVVSPTPGSTLTSSSATFQWTTGTGVSEYQLTVGTEPGGGASPIYDANQGTNLSATVTGLPTNGMRIYVRLWSRISGAWQWTDVSYVAYTATASVPAEMTTPAPGSTLTASTVQFQWTGGTNVQKYWLSVGTTSGGQDLYHQDQGTNLSVNVPGLPTDGRTLYVRLWSFIGVDWQTRDYTYTAGTSGTATPAQMTAPAPGSTLTASTVQFQWNGGTGVSKYWLSMGAAAGGEEIYSADQGTNLSATVSGLPTNGSTLYVRLWSMINGAWKKNDYTYTTGAGGGTTGVPAQMTAPAPGSTLTASTVQFQWNGGTGVSKYWLSMGAAAGGEEIYSVDQGTSLSATVTGLPTNGSTLYVRLWSMINGAWKKNDYTYTTGAGGGGTTGVPAQMTAPAPGSTLTASTVQFQWTGGTGVSQYWLYVGTTAGGNQLFDQDQSTSLSATVSGLPTNGSTVYVRLGSRINGSWVYNDYTYTAMTTGTTGVPAQMTAPAPGSTFTSSTVQFQWNGGTGVSKYWLSIGAALGGEEIYSVDQGTNLSATVTGLPTNGSTLYVRLWSMINGAWKKNDYTYTTGAGGGAATTAAAQMTAPTPGSTFASSTVQFQWTAGTGVTKYWLSIGAAAGGEEIYSVDQGTNLSATVMGLPANGSPLYVRLWSMVNGAWKKNDYVYTAAH